MLLRALFIALFLLAFTSTSQAADSTAEISAQVDQFLKDPLDSTPAPIVKFAQESPDHEVAFSDRYFPWWNEKPEPVGSPLLVAGFVAGNLQEQFKKQTDKTQPYAGVLGIITVYRAIQTERPGYRINGVEQFIELEKKGQLKAFIEQPLPAVP